MATPPKASRGPVARPSLREMQKDLTRRRVMESALEVLAEKGFRATTMDDIANHAGVNRGTIYLHFQNQAEILHAALKDIPPIAPHADAIARAETRAEIQAEWEVLYDLWLSHLAPIWRPIRDASAESPAMHEWFISLNAYQIKTTERALRRRGIPSGLARARAFLFHHMISEFIYRLPDGGSSIPAAQVIGALTDITEAVYRVPGDD